MTRCLTGSQWSDLRSGLWLPAQSQRPATAIGLFQFNSTCAYGDLQSAAIAKPELGAIAIGAGDNGVWLREADAYSQAYTFLRMFVCKFFSIAMF